MSSDLTLCWYCEKRGFSEEHSVVVDLTKNLSTIYGPKKTMEQYLRTKVTIPRCAKCAELHHRHVGGSGVGWFVLGGVLLSIDIIMTISLISDGYSSALAVPILIFLIGAGAIGYGLFQKNKNKARDIEAKRKFAEDIAESGIIRKDFRDGLFHPEVLAYKSQGFEAKIIGEIH